MYVSNIWDSASEFASAIPPYIVELLGVDEIDRMYRACDDECDRVAHRGVPIAKVNDDIVPAQPPDPSASSLRLPQSDGWSKGVVMRANRNATVDGSIEASGAARDSREALRISVLVCALWALFVDIGSDGLFWNSYASMHSDLRSEHECLCRETWSELPASTLSNALSAMTRWKSWAVQRRIPWRLPLPTHVALWLRSLRDRGPTAPHGAFAMLRWVEKHLGFSAHTDAPQVRAQGVVMASHREVQATPLPVRVWAFLESVAAGGNVFASAISLVWILLLVGVLRFAHVQRSRIVAMTDDMISGLASRGKKRVHGRRRPLEWSAPRFGLTGVDIGARLQAYLTRATAGQALPPFLLLDFLPARVQLSGVKSFAPTAMPMHRFVSFSRSLLAGHPLCLSPGECTDITTYSARRVLPSVADAARCSVAERLAIGAWSDPAADGTLQTQAKRMAMPTRYSGQRLVVAACIKASLVKGVATARDRFHKLRPEISDPSWDDILKFYPGQPEDVSSSPSKSRRVSEPQNASDFSWICSRAKSGALHSAVEVGSGASSSTSRPEQVLKTACGRSLSDSLSGMGSVPPGRRVCRLCFPSFSRE